MNNETPEVEILMQKILTFILGFSIIDLKLKKHGWIPFKSSRLQQNKLCTLRTLQSSIIKYLKNFMQFTCSTI